jgi:hypothetical protein
MKKLDKLMEYVLTEEDPIPEPQTADDVAPTEQIEASLDQVVDRYLVRYEQESIPMAGTYEQGLVGTEQEYAKMDDLGEAAIHLLDEAEEDEEEEPAEEEAPVEEPGEEDMGGLDLGEPGGEPAGEPAAEGQPVAATPQINLNDFARSVARLVNNFETLLNPQNIILNRAEAYVASNYDERTARELMDVLDQNYSLRSVEREQEEEKEITYPEPFTPGALSSD